MLTLDRDVGSAERKLLVRPVRLGSVERDEREERVRPVRLCQVEREEIEVGGPEATIAGEERSREERENVAGNERKLAFVILFFRSDNDRRWLI